jgi:hypothetical protein
MNSENYRGSQRVKKIITITLKPRSIDPTVKITKVVHTSEYFLFNFKIKYRIEQNEKRPGERGSG